MAIPSRTDRPKKQSGPPQNVSLSTKVGALWYLGYREANSIQPGIKEVLVPYFGSLPIMQTHLHRVTTLIKSIIVFSKLI